MSVTRLDGAWLTSIGLVSAGAVCWGLAVQAQEAGQQAANSTTTSSSEITVSWIVQRAEQAAGLGVGVFCTGWVLILFLSLVFGNWGLPKAAEGRDDAYAPAALAEVHVNVTQKKEKKQKHKEVSFSCGIAGCASWIQDFGWLLKQSRLAVLMKWPWVAECWQHCHEQEFAAVAAHAPLGPSSFSRTQQASKHLCALRNC